jgi:hypothetical protein
MLDRIYKIYKREFRSGAFGACATLEFVFAPKERDVYNYERPRRDLAPVGAKPGSVTIATTGKSESLETPKRCDTLVFP